MKVRRFLVRSGNIRGQEATIEDLQEIRHMRKVLRLGIGDPVVLFDGSGKEYQATIIQCTPQKIILTVSRELSGIATESPLRIILGMSVLRPNPFEWLIRKATELGAAEIAPFYSSRAVPRWENSDREARQTRWQKIAAEAAKQCRRTKVPPIHSPLPFRQALAVNYGDAGKIFLWEKGGSGSLANVLRPFPETIYALVGPEGGFSELEALQAQEAGFRPVHLGPRILRAETAGIVIMSLLQFIWGDLD
jgi:16S rRNA (uracil1498-N3)-methyltransferase